MSTERDLPPAEGALIASGCIVFTVGCATGAFPVIGDISWALWLLGMVTLGLVTYGLSLQWYTVAARRR